jgi:glycosyltransferase involved in cell wall biosynthesis
LETNRSSIVHTRLNPEQVDSPSIMAELTLDARWLDTGLGTYTSNLLREFHSAGLQFGLVTQSQNVERLASMSNDVRVVDAGMYSLREQIRMSWATRKDRVLHVMHYNAPLMREGTLLVTIHDLTHILDARFRTTLKGRIYARPMLRIAAGKAAHILTVSDYSLQQIVKHLGVSPTKVTVVHNGVSSAFFPEPRRKAQAYVTQLCGFDGPYILFVGSLKPHKNVDGLVRAYALLEQRHQIGRKLLIVGSGEPGLADLRRAASRARVANKVIVRCNLSEDALRMAYSGADVTVLPSFEEGFGLPVLESMACGTPVACSQTASLPEVGGEAAVYFDPTDTDSIASALQGLLQSDEKWNLHQALGLSNARRFSWTNCAERHIEVYRRYLPSRCFEQLPTLVREQHSRSVSE